MIANSYCDNPNWQGLTCLRDNLVLLRKLSEDEAQTATNIILLYQCKVCLGLYKYIYTSSCQTRNFDADEGWQIYSDAYFKVGEKNGAGSVMFPFEEAHIYGYPGTDSELL